MLRFLKNVFNIVIILLAVAGLISICTQVKLDNIKENTSNVFSINKTKITEDVGDFSTVDKEFKIKTAVNVLGCKTVVAKHQNSGQKMIIVNSGKKTLLTKEDIKSDDIKTKLEELCKKFNYDSSMIQSIEITERGYMRAYGQKVPYAKFNAKISKLSDICGIVSVVDEGTDNQKLIVSLNDNKHYSQLITSEFYKNVKEARGKSD